MPASTPEPLRESAAEQAGPLARLRRELADEYAPPMDVERARARLREGRVAYDPNEVLRAAGSLLVPFVRATVALERAGVISNDDAVHARERRFQLSALVAGWLSGEPLPRDRERAAARRAAALVGTSLLSRASSTARDDDAVASRRETNCPYCGGPPEFSVRVGERRTLICNRCDSSWATDIAGCLGCHATAPPTVARVRSVALGYELVICNACGRYLKEPIDVPSRGGHAAELDPLLERVLTSELDAAAEARGLRL